MHRDTAASIWWAHSLRVGIRGTQISMLSHSLVLTWYAYLTKRASTCSRGAARDRVGSERHDAFGGLTQSSEQSPAAPGIAGYGGERVGGEAEKHARGMKEKAHGTWNMEEKDDGERRGARRGVGDEFGTRLGCEFSRARRVNVGLRAARSECACLCVFAEGNEGGVERAGSQ